MYEIGQKVFINLTIKEIIKNSEGTFLMLSNDDEVRGYNTLKVEVKEINNQTEGTTNER